LRVLQHRRSANNTRNAASCSLLSVAQQVSEGADR
jgi:hypothetical protein